MDNKECPCIPTCILVPDKSPLINPGDIPINLIPDNN